MAERLDWKCISVIFGDGVRPIPAGGGRLPSLAAIPVVCGEWVDCKAGDARLGVFGPACKALGDAA